MLSPIFRLTEVASLDSHGERWDSNSVHMFWLVGFVLQWSFSRLNGGGLRQDHTVILGLVQHLLNLNLGLWKEGNSVSLKFGSNLGQIQRKKNLRFCSISNSFLYQEFLFLSVLLPQPELLAQNTRGHLEAWATVHTPPISSGECRNWHQGALLCLILQNPHKKKPLGGLGARSQLRIYLSCKHKNLSSSPSTQRVGGIQVWKCVPINPRMGETETSVIFLASQFTRVQM